jgi:hypothetical protein
MPPAPNLREKITLDAGALEPFEIGARLLALLAFPAPGERKRRYGIEGALCSEIIARTCDDQPETADAIRVRYRRYTKRKQRVSLGSFQKRLNKAMFAGTMALGYLEEGISGQSAKLPTTMPSMSFRNLARHVAQRDGLVDDLNNSHYEEAIRMFVKRTWHPWYPVLHLASAFQVACRMYSMEAEGMPYDIHNLAAHKAVVAYAQMHAAVICREPQLSKVAEQLVDIEWND